MGLLAVYGTLRPPGGLVGACAHRGTERICGWAMYDATGFPYIRPEARNWITVDLMEVDADDLRMCDSFEGVPHHYQREKTGEGYWIYVAADDSVRRLPRIEHGDWKNRRGIT